MARKKRKITYLCPHCNRSAVKTADWYDHTGAASCVSKCPACEGDPLVGTRWFNEAGEEIIQSEICMPAWLLLADTEVV